MVLSLDLLRSSADSSRSLSSIATSALDRCSLSKVAIIIPNPGFGLPSSGVQNSLATLAPDLETFPATPGSTKSLGGHSHSCLSVPVTVSLSEPSRSFSESFGEPTCLSGRASGLKLGGNQVSVSAEEYTNEVEIRRKALDRLSFRTHGRARLPCVNSVRYYQRTPAQLRSRRKQPFPSRIDPYCQCFFTRTSIGARSEDRSQ